LSIILSNEQNMVSGSWAERRKPQGPIWADHRLEWSYRNGF